MHSLKVVLLFVFCLGGVATRWAAGEEPAPAFSVERGVNQLASLDLAVRQQAVWDVGNAGSEADAAVPALVELLGHENDQLRWSAAWALWQIGEKSCEPVAARLRDPNVRARRTASYVLQKLTPNSLKAQRLLLPAAADADRLVRQHAYTAISFLSPERAKLLTAERHALRIALISGLEPPSKPSNFWEIRRSVNLLRTQLGPAIPAEVPTLTALLASESPTTRIACCQTLEQLGPAAHESSAQLAALLDDDSEVGNAALAALTAIGPQAKVATPQLLDRIERLRARPSANFRKEIALLVQWQADAKAAVPVLLKVAKELESRTVRREKRGHSEAVASIGRIATEVPPELLQQLSDSSAEARRVAAEAIGGFGSRATPAVPRLVAMLHDDNETAALAALVAIEQIGPAAAEAIPVLAQIVRKKNTGGVEFFLKHHSNLPFGDSPHPRLVQVLGKLGPQALPELREFLSHESDAFRTDAAIGLGHLGPVAGESTAERIVPALVEAIHDKNHATAQAAIVSLGALATAARPSIAPLIEKLTASSHRDQFRAILTALVRIDPQDARIQAALRDEALAAKSYWYKTTAPLVLLEAGQATEEELWQYFDDVSIVSAIAASSPTCQSLASTHVPLLLRCLNDEGSHRRRTIAGHLLRYADFHEHPEVLDALARVCGSNDPARYALLGLSTSGSGTPHHRAVLPLVRQLRSESETCRRTALLELDYFLLTLRPYERWEIDRLIADPPSQSVETVKKLVDRMKYFSIRTRPRPYDELVRLALAASDYDVTCELAEYGAAAVPALKPASWSTIARLKCQGIEALPGLERIVADVTKPQFARTRISESLKWLSMDLYPMVPQRK